MHTISGNLIQLAEIGKFDVIIHGCNCFCTMGAGVAVQIAKKWPQAEAADNATAAGDPKKLGGYTYATDGPLTIVNAYTQYRYGTEKMHLDYEALRTVFRKIAQDFKGKRIGYPMIGSERAGGDWKVISQIIEEELAGEDHCLVVYEAPISSAPAVSTSGTLF